MPTKYEIVYQKEHGDQGNCDRCGFEDRMLETIETRNTTTLASGTIRLERLCRYCYESELGQIVKYKHYDSNTRALARGLCQALNVLELAVSKRNA